MLSVVVIKQQSWETLNVQRDTNTAHQIRDAVKRTYTIIHRASMNSEMRWQRRWIKYSKMHRGNTIRPQRPFLFFTLVKPQSIPRYKSALGVRPVSAHRHSQFHSVLPLPAFLLGEAHSDARMRRTSSSDSFLNRTLTLLFPPVTLSTQINIASRRGNKFEQNKFDKVNKLQKCVSLIINYSYSVS